MKSSHLSFWEASSELHQSNTPFVVVTLINVRGHAPQEMGAKMLVTSKGLHWGTIGGGRLEARGLDHSASLFKKEKFLAPPELLTVDLQRELGMTCGGEVTLLFETHQRADGWNIVVFGAGHVGQAVVRVLDHLACNITCVDPRPEWIEKLPDSPKIKKVCLPDIRDYLKEADPNSFFAVMTRGHITDLEILEAIYKKFPNAPYIGSMGSDLKAQRLKSDLCASGIPAELVETLHSPIGLDIGCNDPYEIAISIAAELLQQRCIKSGDQN